MTNVSRRGFLAGMGLVTSGLLSMAMPTEQAFAATTPITAWSDHSQTVYSGPSYSYVSVGSIGNETVYVMGTEQGWYKIIYNVGNGATQKSGYVPISELRNVSGGTPQEDDFWGGIVISATNQTVYSCDDYAKKVNIGSVSAMEGITKLYGYNASSSGGGSYPVAFVEYSTSSGPKRGYIFNPNFIYVGNTCVARVTQGTNVSYGYHSGFNFLNAGSVSAGEYVAVIATSDSKNLAYIEYNTNNKRKRGYVSKSCLRMYHEDNLPNLYGFGINPYGITMGGNSDVYAGPSKQYNKVGSVYANEVVAFVAEVPINGVYYRYIYYDVDGTNSQKAGFLV